MASLNKFFGTPLPGPAPIPDAAAATPVRRRRKDSDEAVSESKKKRDIRGPPGRRPPAPRAGGRRHLQKSKPPDSPKAKECRKSLKVPKGRTAEWRILRRAGLKAPKTAYMLWMKDNRVRISRELGVADFATISKAAGEAWTALSEKERAPYAERQRELSNKYSEVQATYREYAKNHAAPQRRQRLIFAAAPARSRTRRVLVKSPGKEMPRKAKKPRTEAGAAAVTATPSFRRHFKSPEAGAGQEGSLLSQELTQPYFAGGILAANTGPSRASSRQSGTWAQRRAASARDA